MTFYSKILTGFFEHERQKPIITRTSQQNVFNLPQLNPLLNIGIGVDV